MMRALRIKIVDPPLGLLYLDSDRVGHSADRMRGSAELRVPFRTKLFILPEQVWPEADLSSTKLVCSFCGLACPTVRKRNASVLSFLGLVSRKSRKFTCAFRVTRFSLYLENEARNFVVILIFIPFTTCQKTSFAE